ncbi:MAG: peptidoglycan DD-metalloendopeptidase family protein [Betaproteobacteria bacterium]
MRCARFLLALALNWAAAPAAAAGTAADQAADLGALRARIESLKAELGQKEAAQRESQDALRESERSISDATRELGTLETESRTAQEELQLLGARQRGLAEGLAKEQAAVARMLNARHAAGPPDLLRVLLTGNDPNDAARHLYYLGEIAGATARVLARYRADAAELDKVSRSAAEKTTRLAAIEAAKRTGRQKIVAESRERKRVLDRFSLDIRASRREIKGLLADESRLGRLVEEIGKVLTAKPGAGFTRREAPPVEKATVPLPDAIAGPFSALRGKLRLPVRGELSTRFGSPRSEGGGSSKGVFIRSPEGQQVRAVAAGRVVYADWMRGFGNLLIVDHGETYLSVYANNEALLKQPGEPVSAGEAIATVGSTGGSAETGLYFELRHLGKAFDPLRWSNLR